MRKEKFVAFVCGDFVSTSFFLLFASGWPTVAQVVSTAAFGVLGGIASLAGKDLYNFLKSFINKNKPPKNESI